MAMVDSLTLWKNLRCTKYKYPDGIHSRVLRMELDHLEKSSLESSMVSASIHAKTSTRTPVIIDAIPFIKSSTVRCKVLCYMLGLAEAATTAIKLPKKG